MLTVAIGADGGVLVALGQCQAVHAGPVGPGLRRVAGGAGGGNVLGVHARGAGHGTVHLMAAMAVHAVGGLGIALGERLAVHALPIALDEMCAHHRAGGDAGIGKMAGQAEPGLFGLHVELVGAAPRHSLLVT